MTSLWRALGCLFRGGCCHHPTGEEVPMPRMLHITGGYRVTEEEVQCCRCQMRTWREKKETP